MRKIGAVIPEVLREVSSNEDVALIFLGELWPQFAGEKLAGKTKPYSLRNKVLTVRVPDVAWKDQLVEYRQILKNSINEFWGVRLVYEIKFKAPGEL